MEIKAAAINHTQPLRQLLKSFNDCKCDKWYLLWKCHWITYQDCSSFDEHKKLQMAAETRACVACTVYELNVSMAAIVLRKKLWCLFQADMQKKLSKDVLLMLIESIDLKVGVECNIMVPKKYGLVEQAWQNEKNGMLEWTKSILLNAACE